MLLTGVKGISKTTLMQGLCKILSQLQGTMLICVYHNYKISAKFLPVKLLSTAIQGRSLPLPYNKASDNFSTCLAKVWQKGYHMVMFLDKIQVLYINQSNPSYKLCITIV